MGEETKARRFSIVNLRLFFVRIEMSTRRRTAPPVRRAIAPPQPSNPGPPPPPPPPAKRVKYYTPKEEQEEEEEAAEYDEYIGNHSPEPEGAFPVDFERNRFERGLNRLTLADVVHIMIRRPPSLFISEEDREMVERTKRRMLKQEEAYHHCGSSPSPFPPSLPCSPLPLPLH